MPVVSLDQVSMTYGHLPLLDDATLRLEPGERVVVSPLRAVSDGMRLRVAEAGSP